MYPKSYNAWVLLTGVWSPGAHRLNGQTSWGRTNSSPLGLIVGALWAWALSTGMRIPSNGYPLHWVNSPFARVSWGELSELCDMSDMNESSEISLNSLISLAHKGMMSLSSDLHE